MIEWDEWSDAEAATSWDATVGSLPEHSVYQAYGWGEYKRRAGWQVRRGVVLIDGARAATAQCLVREVRLARLVVVWVPGGPAGSVPGRLHLGRALRRRYRGWSLCLRANIVAEKRAVDDAEMRAAGWVPADVRVGGPLTFHLDLTQPEAERRAALHANWRHNLRRGEARSAETRVWGAGDPIEPVYDVYRQMIDLKRLAAAMGLADLQALRGAFGCDFTLVVSAERDGTLSAVRGCARIGSRGYDLLAAVTPVGRRTYASYVAMWRLLDAVRAQGVRLYDVSGADPGAAGGVYNFKRGLAGRRVSMVGEWEWSTSRLLRWGVNRALLGREANVAPAAAP